MPHEAKVSGGFFVIFQKMFSVLFKFFAHQLKQGKTDDNEIYLAP